MSRRARRLLVGLGAAAALAGSLVAWLAPHEAGAPFWARWPLYPALLGLAAAVVLAVVAFLGIRPLAERRPDFYREDRDG